MGITLVIQCPNCGGLLMAGESQKTRRCPYCGARIQVMRANRLASAENSFEASIILRSLKNQRGFSTTKKK